MLTNGQKALLKSAQRQAALSDQEYRDAIALVSGMPDCRSSKDQRLTDDHLDHLMAYLEAIYWRKVDAAHMQHVFRDNAVFRQRGFWAQRNQRGNTTRDRYTEGNLTSQIRDLESKLAQAGCNAAYCRGIKTRMQRSGPVSDHKYAAALRRTLESRLQRQNQPF